MAQFQCPACGVEVPPEANLTCPACGIAICRPVSFVAMDEPYPVPPPLLVAPPLPPWVQTRRPPGSLLGDCLLAPIHALTRQQSLLLLLRPFLLAPLIFLGMSVLLSLLAGLAGGRLDLKPLPRAMEPLVYMVGILILLEAGGYAVRCLADIACWTAEGYLHPPPLPAFHWKQNPLFFFRMLGVALVYVLPLVTLPLLPLGLLGLSKTADARCMRLGWALRAGRSRPGPCLLAGLFCALWFLAAAAMGLAAAYIAFRWVRADPYRRSSIFVMAGIVAIAVLQTLCAVFAVAAGRCAAGLGSRRAEVLDELYQTEPNAASSVLRGAAALCVCVGAAVGVYAIAGDRLDQVAAAWKESLARLTGDVPPVRSRPPMIEAVEPEPVRPPRPDEILARRRKRMEKLARAASTFIHRRQGELPTSLEDLKAHGDLQDEDLEGRTYLFVQRVGNPREDILLYEPPAPDELGLWFLTVDFYGQVAQRREHEMSDLLSLQGRPLLLAEARIVQYGHGPGSLTVLRRRKSADGPLRDRVLHNLQNLDADLRAFHSRNSRYPSSLEELRTADFVPDPADLASPGPAGSALIYLAPREPPGRSRDGNRTSDDVLAYDTAVCEPGPLRYGIYNLLTPAGVEETGAFELLLHLKTSGHRPQIAHRRYRIETNDPPHVRAVKNLSNFRDDLEDYAARHDGRYPGSIKDLQESGCVGDPADLRSTSDPSRSYVYLGGQSSDSPATNILAYDPVPCRGLIAEARAAAQVGMNVLLYVGQDKVEQALVVTGQHAVRGEMMEFAREPDSSPEAGGTVRHVVAVAASQPAVESGKVAWSLPWPRGMLARLTHPLKEVCDDYWVLAQPGATVAVGVKFGPAASSRDTVYGDFRSAMKEALGQVSDQRADLYESGSMLDRMVAGEKVQYVRYEAPFRGTGQACVLWTSIEGRRCVAYWFVGPSHWAPLGESRLGTARWTSDAIVARPRLPHEVSQRPYDSKYPPMSLPASLPAAYSSTEPCQVDWKSLWGARELGVDRMEFVRQHPLWAVCDDVRRLGLSRYLGVTVGPKAKHMDTPVFIEFTEAMVDAYYRHAPDVRGEAMPRPWSIAGRTVHGCLRLAAESRRGESWSLVLTVENGRCAAYWHVGVARDDVIVPLLGKTRWTVRDQPSGWKGREATAETVWASLRPWYRPRANRKLPPPEAVDVCEVGSDPRRPGEAWVVFGPPAKSERDQAYIDFRQKAWKELAEWTRPIAIAPRPPAREELLSPVQTSPAQTAGGHRPRWLESRFYRRKGDPPLVAVYLVIQDGRSVAYWYHGWDDSLSLFESAVGGARPPPAP